MSLYNRHIVKIFDSGYIPGLGQGPYIDPPIIISDEHYRTLKALEYNIKKIGELILVQDNSNNELTYIENNSIGKNKLDKNLQDELDKYKLDIERLKNSLNRINYNLPKISDRNTWLVFDYPLNCYVDTGIRCDAGAIAPTSIKSLSVDENHHLIVTLTDDTTQDAGEFPPNIPIKGIDYWTDEDKQEINNYIINNIDLSSLGFINQEELREFLDFYVTKTTFEESQQEQNERISKNSEDIANFQETLDTITEEQENLNSKYEELNDTIENINNIAENAANKVDYFDNKINNYDNKIKELNSTVENYTRIVDENSDDIRYLGEDLRELSEKVETNTEDIETLKEKVDENSQNIENNTITINVINDRVSVNEDNINYLNQRLNILEKKDAGKIDTITVNLIKIEPDENKNINLTIPTKVSDLENDLDFVQSRDLVWHELDELDNSEPNN